MGNQDLLKELFLKYKLNYDKENPNSKANDVFVHKHYTIITRQGIQKIEKAAGIHCTMYVEDAISTPTNVTLSGSGQIRNAEGKAIQEYRTFASASAETSTNKYYAEMAEKRCRSRLVLTLAGLYELGVYGEDEADSFQKVVKDATEGVAMPAVKTAIYKGGSNG